MPLSVADRLEILDLLSRYAHAIDTCDGEAYADCFTDDGVFEMRDAGLCIEGREALAELGRSDQALHGAAGHLWNSPIIEGDGDRALMRVYTLRLNTNSAKGLGIAGVCQDTLRRVGGRWRFERRDIYVDPLRPARRS